MIDDLDDLVARDPQTFRDRFRIDVRTRHEAMAIDVDAATVEVRDLERGRTFQLGYDHLLLGTGARPIRPPLPGIDLPHVHGVQTLDDAASLLAEAERLACEHVVVVGGGYIGLEMAEAFVHWGADVTLVEAGDQVMRTLDADMAELVADALHRFDIELLLDTPVQGFADGTVVLPDREIPAQLVVLGLGVTPNSEVAAGAGIELGSRDAILVDRRQRTSAEHVWAAGDCATSFHLVREEPVHVALGTVANKQGRVAGINLAGGYATFPGVVGTAITRVCTTEIARTGVTEVEARAAGFEFDAVTITSKTRAHYFPGAQDMTVKLVVESGTGRILGAQIVGGEGSAKRIDTIATAVTVGMTVQQMVDLDLSYAPPFSPVWDPVQVAARRALRGG
jgi:NADPH-dependent 2,4-dienoyl-CoA reductase/sulfur reductase-like enzyme